MYEMTIAILIGTIFCLILSVVLQNNTVKRQEKNISDLMDRLMAERFNDYAIARERKQEIEMADKGLKQIVEEYGDQDAFRVE